MPCKRVAKPLLFLLPALLSVFGSNSCGRVTSNSKNTVEGDSSTVFFAKLFDIQSDTLISYNTWEAELKKSEKYLLVPRDCVALLAREQMAIGVPIRSCISMSTTYLPFLKLLGCMESVKGVSGTKFVYDADYQAIIADGKIADVGPDTSPDYELILSIKPDVVLAYGIAGSDNSYISKLRELGIKVVVVNDYLESTPIEKLEYLKFFGALTGKEALADSLFNDRYAEYESIKAYCSAYMDSYKADRVKALVNIPFKDIWYLPSKESVLSALVEDAGGEILGAKSGGPFSSQESFERMYLLAMEADVWLHQNSIQSADELAAENKFFADIPAFKAGRLYNNTKRVTLRGGSDYWEGGAVEPAEILLDLVQIFHPAALPKEYEGRELKYYNKLK